MTPNRADLESLARRILDRIGIELTARGSSLVDRGALAIGIEPQVRSILAEAVLAIDSELPARDLVSIDYRDADLAAKGRILAMRDYDPAEPLVVGELLFGLALPELAHLLPDADPIHLARSLHHAIWRRFPPAAISYVELLREQLRLVETSSRERLARELHDRIAHDLLVGVQLIELAKLEDAGTTDLVRAAEGQLRLVLAEVRALAHDLRLDTAGRTLDEALDDLVNRDPLDDLPLHREHQGMPLILTRMVVAECFAIVLEAVRNARRHATNSTRIVIGTEWQPDALIITISDDGGAFEPPPAGTLGFAGMHERAQRIGGTVNVSTDDIGTTVQLCLKFGGRPA